MSFYKGGFCSAEVKTFQLKADIRGMDPLKKMMKTDNSSAPNRLIGQT